MLNSLNSETSEILRSKQSRKNVVFPLLLYKLITNKHNANVPYLFWNIKQKQSPKIGILKLQNMSELKQAENVFTQIFFSHLDIQDPDLRMVSCFTFLEIVGWYFFWKCAGVE